MPTTISQQIVGELIIHEKYTFVDGKLIYNIVNDAIAEYEKLTEDKRIPKEKRDNP